MFYIIYKQKKKPVFVCVWSFFKFFFKEKPRVIRLVMLQEGGLICMQPRLHQQILITVSKKPVCV